MSIAGPPVKKRKGNTMDEITEGANKDTSGKFYNVSPDMFADCSPEIIPDVALQIEGFEEDEVDTDSEPLANALIQADRDEENDGCSWRGVSLPEMQAGSGFWGLPQHPPINPSNNHSVLFQVPPGTGQPPPRCDAWDHEHVRMPYSPQSLYPVTVNGDKSSLRSRWELVEEALLKSITSSLQLEAAILSYNSKYSKHWDFSALHYFFSEIMEPSEVSCFFNTLLPGIIQLALQLPELVQSPIPLLRQHRNYSLSLSQLQIASLLANALLCTFPRRNTAKRFSEYASFPDINFNRLFQLHKKKVSQRNSEKLKCLFHYFRRVCRKAPRGAVTFTRSYIPLKSMPQWDRSNLSLRKLHVTSQGTIENQGHGMLQVDFANKLVGGGVLGWGCVQEEIRFVICPELIISRLFTECLDSTEALHITGCERFSDYSGYSDSFQWEGDHQDTSPRDSSGRLMCSIVAMDALAFRNPNLQFTPQNLTRELNKAYVGFHNIDIPAEHLSAVATGNWGCGVYRGNARLKALLQLMAAAQAGRHLAYFTFGDKALRDQLFLMYTFLTEQHVTICQLWRLLCQYYDQCFQNGKMIMDLYPFLYQMLKSKSGLSKGPIGMNLSFETATHSPVNSRNNQKSKDTDSGLKQLEIHQASTPTQICVLQKVLQEHLEGDKLGAKKKLTNSSCSSNSKEKEHTEDSSKVEQSSSGPSSRRGSWLEHCDKKNFSPLPKRKISDYFNAVNVPK